MTEYRTVIVGAGGVGASPTHKKIVFLGFSVYADSKKIASVSFGISKYLTCVGKSAITVRFVQGNFVEKYDPTIEDSYRKQLEVDGQSCMLDVMDTAGQEEYSALRDSYMKTGQGFVLVYDITSATSFDLATKLRTQIIRLKEDTPDIPTILVGNKCDLEKIRKVPKEKAQAFATQHRMGFIEASAKTNVNITEIFNELVRRIRVWRERNPEKQIMRHPKKKCTLL